MNIHLTTPRPIVLASGSPRRRMLLNRLGIRYSVRLSMVDEAEITDDDPRSLVVRLASHKAGAVSWERAPEEQATESEGTAAQPPPIIIGADTVVVIDGDVLGKPRDSDEATAMLTRLRGRSHQVLTGLAVLDTSSGTTHTSVVATDVHMRDFPDAELTTYIATGEPFDKAGGYGIQGQASHLIERFEGCYFNVVGFPLCEVATLLHRCNIIITAPDPVCVLPGGHPCPRLTA